MYLIQLLLPLYSNTGKPFDKDLFDSVKKEMTENFGGVTCYTHAPATGLWKESEEKIIRDEIILFEVMVSEIDKNYWQNYKTNLEDQFHQNDIIIRASPVQVL